MQWMAIVLLAVGTTTSQVPKTYSLATLVLWFKLFYQKMSELYYALLAICYELKIQH